MLHGNSSLLSCQRQRAPVERDIGLQLRTHVEHVYSASCRKLDAPGVNDYIGVNDFNGDKGEFGLCLCGLLYWICCIGYFGSVLLFNKMLHLCPALRLRPGYTDKAPTYNFPQSIFFQRCKNKRPQI